MQKVRRVADGSGKAWSRQKTIKAFIESNARNAPSSNGLSGAREQLAPGSRFEPRFKNPHTE